jgi:hypothetical protein
MAVVEGYSRVLPPNGTPVGAPWGTSEYSRVLEGYSRVLPGTAEYSHPTALPWALPGVPPRRPPRRDTKGSAKGNGGAVALKYSRVLQGTQGRGTLQGSLQGTLRYSAGRCLQSRWPSGRRTRSCRPRRPAAKGETHCSRGENQFLSAARARALLAVFWFAAATCRCGVYSVTIGITL